MEIKIEGMEELQKKMENIAQEQSFNDVIKKATLKLQNLVKMSTPVDTGRARASITPQLGGKGVDSWGKVGTNVKYYPFIEFGTAKMEARYVTEVATSEARYAGVGGVKHGRVLGEGPFTHSIKVFEKEMPDIAKLLAIELEKAWDK